MSFVNNNNWKKLIIKLFVNQLLNWILVVYVYKENPEGLLQMKKN
jgi:hypothetical protein